MPAQPADLARQLFDRLVRAADEGVPDDLEIRRLERDAKALLKVDPGRANQILGGVAALRWDVEALRSHHEAALPLGKASAYRNYATSLQLVGLFQEAAKYIAIASERQPTNLTWLRAATSFALWAGQPKTALQMQRELAKRDPENVSTESIDAIEGLMALMEKHEISEADLQAAMGVAFRFLRERKLRFTHVSLLNDGDQEAAFFSILLDRPVKEVLTLDAELGREFADQMPDLNSALVVQLEPLAKQAPARANDGQAARPT